MVNRLGQNRLSRLVDGTRYSPGVPSAVSPAAERRTPDNLGSIPSWINALHFLIFMKNDNVLSRKQMVHPSRRAGGRNLGEH